MARPLPWLLLAGAVCGPALGCHGCLHLEDYELVPAGAGGFGAGAGGSTAACTPTGDEFVFAVVPFAAGAGDPAGDTCNVPSNTAPDGGLALVALETEDGACRARFDVARPAQGRLDALPRASVSSRSGLLVAARYAGGSIALPPTCTDSVAVVVDEVAGATDSAFVARVLVTGAGLCTSWVRRIYTATPGAELTLTALSGEPAGPVALAGTLGGALVHFEQGAGTNDITGGAFLARYAANGSLDEVAVLGSNDDVVQGVGRVSGGWLVSGGLREADPACHACAGTLQVSNAVGCLGAGGAGAGGNGAGGGGAGAGAGGNGAGGGATDTTNAFMWSRADSDVACENLTTFGFENAQDAQLGFGIDTRPSATCDVVWAGFAGRSSFRFASGDATTALFATSGATSDGFITRFGGGAGSDCLAGASPTWNVRLTPSVTGASAWGNRALLEHCNGTGSVTTVLVTNGSGGRLELERCETGGTCATDSTDVDLPSGTGAELVVLGLTASGSLGWRGAFGPLALAPGSPAWHGPAAARDDLALGAHDEAYLAFTTSGPLQTTSVEPFGCSELDPNAPAGTYVVRLHARGFAGRAMCDWARRFGP